MDSDKYLRIVIQATGIYFVAQSLLTALASVSHYVTWHFLERSDSFGDAYRQTLINGFVYAALMLIPAWILLAKSDWCARAVSDMSKPRAESDDLE